ncbi:tetratricopeptide repeat protein [Luteolibacter pohnpeiensis]|uniref:Tetratricopeptide repeat protein n=1 Tax=Luteolibacter pohnpeiensis TaxID=454153 RepID=A0A934S6W0_9BACT|nr:tetratricopeptide repeat protein [Luteolibacter pohnpeiensis]MBK1882284.1 tetratricopeptide repeat protein [Luteolibacter pohnpeiensis]
MIKKLTFAFALSALPLLAHPSPEHKLKEIEQHLVDHPNDPELLRLQANLLIERRPKKAVKIVKQLMKADPNNRENRLLQARLDAVTGKPDQARKELAGLLEADPGLDQAWGLLSQLQESAGMRDDAITSAIAAIEHSPSPSPSRILTCAGWLQERGKTGDADTAIRLIDRGLARLGCLAGLHEMAITIEIDTGKYDSALRRVDAMEARYRPTVALSLRRAEILEKAQRYGEAANACDAAVAIMDLAPPSRKKSEDFQQQRAALLERKATDSHKASH